MGKKKARVIPASDRVGGVVTGLVVLGCAAVPLVVMAYQGTHVAGWVLFGCFLPFGLWQFFGGLVRLTQWRALVLRHDCLQLTERGSSVVGQVPYDNIAAARWVTFHEGNEWFQYMMFGIKFRDADDPDTWWPRVYDEKGYNVLLSDGYELSLQEIEELLIKRLARGA